MRKGSAELSSLTPREEEVLGHIRNDLSNEQIAQQMGISIAGVKYHVSEILGKLGVENRHDAARWTPDQRPWWQLAGILLSIPRPPLGWLSPAVGAALAVIVVIAAGLLVWALLATRGEESVSGPGPAGPLTAELVLDRPSPSFGAIDFVSDDDGWMLVAGGLLRTADGGESWTEASRVTGADIDFFDERHGWIVGSSGSIYATTDGESWVAQDSGTDVNLSDVYAVSDREAWAVGTGDGSRGDAPPSFPPPAVLLHTADGGATWDSVDVPRGSWFRSVTFIGDEGWVVGHACTVLEPPDLPGYSDSCDTDPESLVLYTTDGGGRWTMIEGSEPEGARGRIFIDSQHGWLIGDCDRSSQTCNESLFRTSDGGRTWQQVRVNGVNFMTQVAFGDELSGWALGRSGCEVGSCLSTSLLKTTDGGATWTNLGEVAGRSGRPPRSIQTTGDRVYLTGFRVALLSDDDGDSFEQMGHPAITFHDIDFVDVNHGYALSASGLYRSFDGGRNWSFVGALPEDALVLDFATPDVGFVGAGGGAAKNGIWATNDGGKSWELNETLPAGEPGVPRYLEFINSQFGVLRTFDTLFVTTDAGGTWKESAIDELAEAGYLWLDLTSSVSGRTIHQIVRMDAAGEAQGLIGRLGETWQELSRAEDFVITDALNAWVSVSGCGPMCMELWQTADAGRTWRREKLDEAGGYLTFADPEHGWMQPISYFQGPNLTVDGRTLLYKID